jgi:hypothetical protein
MKNHALSAKISLGLCIFFAAVLAAALFTFPAFMQWFYAGYHHLNPENETVIKNVRTVTVSFYACAPFAAAALYMLIRLLTNILREQVFILTNVRYLRLISWCCWAVALITLAGGCFYFPLFIICASMAVVGTLLRVVKNVVHAAVALREENELTI